ncbi:MAG: hypothetical protein ACR2NL_06330 [Acidimicrobiia bacterium]
MRLPHPHPHLPHSREDWDFLIEICHWLLAGGGFALVMWWWLVV